MQQSEQQGNDFDLHNADIDRPQSFLYGLHPHCFSPFVDPRFTAIFVCCQPQNGKKALTSRGESAILGNTGKYTF